MNLKIIAAGAAGALLLGSIAVAQSNAGYGANSPAAPSGNAGAMNSPSNANTNTANPNAMSNGSGAYSADQNATTNSADTNTGAGAETSRTAGERG